MLFARYPDIFLLVESPSQCPVFFQILVSGADVSFRAAQIYGRIRHTGSCQLSETWGVGCAARELSGNIAGSVALSSGEVLPFEPALLFARETSTSMFSPTGGVLRLAMYVVS